jgi:hypothetical protein
MLDEPRTGIGPWKRGTAVAAEVDGVLGLAESRDGILGHQFNKRLGSFAPCSSHSLLLGDFIKDNHNFL